MLNLNLKVGLGSWVESWRDWDWVDKRIYRRGNYLVVDSERVSRVLVVVILIFCKGK